MTTPRPASLLLLAGAALTAAAPAARAADEELAQLDADYRTRREALVAPLRTAYISKLRTLAETYSRQSDSQRAAAIQAEIDAVSAPTPPLFASEKPSTSPGSGKGTSSGGNDSSGGGGGGDSKGPLVLRADKATISGGKTTYNADREGHIIESDGRGIVITWKAPPIRPGRYRLRVGVGCPVGNTAELEIKIGDAPAFPWRLTPTGDSGSTISANLGEWDFVTPPAAITITVKDLAIKNKSYSAVLVGNLKVDTPIEGLEPAPPKKS